MSINDKDFKVKNGLSVAGDAAFNSNLILQNTPIAYDADYKRLKMYVDNQWVIIPISSDIVDTSQPLDGGGPGSTFSGIAVLDGGTV